MEQQQQVFVLNILVQEAELESSKFETLEDRILGVYTTPDVALINKALTSIKADFFNTSKYCEICEEESDVIIHDFRFENDAFSCAFSIYNKIEEKHWYASASLIDTRLSCNDNEVKPRRLIDKDSEIIMNPMPFDEEIPF